MRYQSPNRKNPRNYSTSYSNYNQTSEAYKYSPNYDYETERQNRPKRKIKKIEKTKYVAVEKDIKVYSLKFFVTLAILATFITSVVFVEALIIQKRFEIDDLNKTLKEVNENNSNLEIELAKNLDLEYIEKIASTELGMQKPASHQVVHINVPKESYSEKSFVEKNSNNFLAKIFNN